MAAQVKAGPARTRRPQKNATITQNGGNASPAGAPSWRGIDSVGSWFSLSDTRADERYRYQHRADLDIGGLVGDREHHAETTEPPHARPLPVPAQGNRLRVGGVGGARRSIAQKPFACSRPGDAEEPAPPAPVNTPNSTRTTSESSSDPTPTPGRGTGRSVSPPRHRRMGTTHRHRCPRTDRRIRCGPVDGTSRLRIAVTVTASRGPTCGPPTNKAWTNLWTRPALSTKCTKRRCPTSPERQPDQVDHGAGVQTALRRPASGDAGRRRATAGTTNAFGSTLANVGWQGREAGLHPTRVMVSGGEDEFEPGGVDRHFS